MSENMGNPNPNQYRNAKADAKAAQAYAKASRPWFKKKRFWALGVIVLIILISAVSGGGGDSGSGSDSNEAGSSSDTGGSGGSGSGGGSDEELNDKPAAKPVRVDAATILKEFEENEAAADGKYKDKALLVSGAVNKVDTEFIDEDQYVVQIGTGSDFEFLTVNCDDQSADAVSALAQGDDITVAGDFEDGGDLGVELQNCEIR